MWILPSAGASRVVRAPSCTSTFTVWRMNCAGAASVNAWRPTGRLTWVEVPRPSERPRHETSTGYGAFTVTRPTGPRINEGSLEAFGSSLPAAGEGGREAAAIGVRLTLTASPSARG